MSNKEFLALWPSVNSAGSARARAGPFRMSHCCLASKPHRGWESGSPLRVPPSEGGLTYMPMVADWLFGLRFLPKRTKSRLVPRPQRCPLCGGGLHGHGSYPRKAEFKHLQVELWVPRVRCPACARTWGVLPRFLAPYQRMVTPLRELTAYAWAKG